MRTFGPESAPLTAAEFGKVKVGMRFLEDDYGDVIARSVVTELPQMGKESSTFFGFIGEHIAEKRLRVLDCDECRPADQPTADALGREAEKPMWGERSDPLTEDEARRLPNGANVLLYAFLNHGGFRWIGQVPSQPSYAFLDIEEDKGKWPLSKIRPADLACAVAIRRVEGKGAETFQEFVIKRYERYQTNRGAAYIALDEIVAKAREVIPTDRCSRAAGLGIGTVREILS